MSDTIIVTEAVTETVRLIERGPQGNPGEAPEPGPWIIGGTDFDWLAGVPPDDPYYMSDYPPNDPPWSNGFYLRRSSHGTVYANTNGTASTDPASDAPLITLPLAYRPATEVDGGDAMIGADGVVTPKAPMQNLNVSAEYPAWNASPPAPSQIVDPSSSFRVRLEGDVVRLSGSITLAQEFRGGSSLLKIAELPSPYFPWETVLMFFAVLIEPDGSISLTHQQLEGGTVPLEGQSFVT